MLDTPFAPREGHVRLRAELHNEHVVGRQCWFFLGHSAAPCVCMAVSFVLWNFSPVLVRSIRKASVRRHSETVRISVCSGLVRLIFARGRDARGTGPADHLWALSLGPGRKKTLARRARG